MARASKEPGPRITARARLRPKAQLTLPEEIRRALGVEEGDEIQFAVYEDGTITVRGFVSIPSDEALCFTPGQQAGKGQTSQDVAAGGSAMPASTETMFARLDTLGTGVSDGDL